MSPGIGMGWILMMLSSLPFFVYGADGTTMRMVIARPFSINDLQRLSQSFDSWDEHPPCSNIAEIVEGNKSSTSSQFNDIKVDLLLVYSRTLEQAEDNDSNVKDAIEKVTKKFHQTRGWDSCIRKVHSIGVGIDPNLDFYNATQQTTNPLWVNGPNRHFERTIRFLQQAGQGGGGSQMKADVMYWMEMDSIPVKGYWLDALTSEMYKVHQNNGDDGFAILGSKYRGDKWNMFRDQLPVPLLNHINGNAIYNLTHPLLNHLVEKLESEAYSIGNTVPFDYRISQLIYEAQTGVKPQFHTYHVKRDIDIPLRINPMASQHINADDHDLSPSLLSSWSDKFDFDKLIRDIPIIGNYARTNLVPELLDEQSYIVHGANMLNNWDDKTMGSIGLVISDWHDIKSQAILSELEKIDHPFSEVVVLLPPNVELPPTPTAELSTKKRANGKGDPPLTIRYVSRKKRRDYEDLCTTPIKSTWFLMTNTYHRLRANLHAMTTYEDSQAGRYYKPLASYIEATDESCYNFDSCRRDLDFTKQHVMPTMLNIYQDFDLVFHNRLRRKYCRYWKRVTMDNVVMATTEGTITDSTASVGAAGAPLLPVPPSATSYMAYLQSQDVMDDMYALSDRAIYGSRPPFLPLKDADSAATVPSKAETPSIRRHLQLAQDALHNQTDCTILSTATDCVSSTTPCLWQPNFASCTNVVLDGNGNINQAVIGPKQGDIGPPRDHRPRWLTILIGIGLAGGMIALLGLVGVGARQTFQYYYMEHVRFPIHDSSTYDDIDGGVVGAGGDGSMSAQLSGGSRVSLTASPSPNHLRDHHRATNGIVASGGRFNATSTGRNQYHQSRYVPSDSFLMEEIDLHSGDDDNRHNTYRFATFANHYSSNEIILEHDYGNDAEYNSSSAYAASDSSGGRSGNLGIEVVNMLLNQGHFEQQTWENSVEYVRDDIVDL